MTHPIDDNLNKLGVELPEPPAPAATYDAFLLTGKTLYVSGQLPMKDGQLAYQGKLDRDFSIEAGAEAAKLCAINILSQVKKAIEGDWSKLEKCVKLTGFVNSTPDFTKHPLVINGASQFMIDALGPEIGRHARSAVGVAALPFDVLVEVEAIFQLK